MEFGALLDANTRNGLQTEEAIVDAVYADTMSLEAVKAKIKALVLGLDVMVARANDMVIKDDASRADAVALGVDAKRLAKLIDTQRKDAIAEPSEFVSSVNNLCSTFIDRLVVNARKTNLDSIEAIIKRKISRYQDEVEMERRKKEAEAKRIKDELQAKLDAEAAEANRKAEEDARLKAIADAQAKGAGAEEMAALIQGAVAEAQANAVEAPSVPNPVFPQASGPVRAENGGSAYSAKNWVCTIVDPSLVPREYCAPVQKLLNDAVKQGVRSIPGCEIKEDTSVRFRC
jgi:hypothetical protein